MDNIKHNDRKDNNERDEVSGKTTHKNEVSNQDNIKHIDGNGTTVCDDEQGINTHKTKVGKRDNIKNNEDNVTTVGDEETGTTAHKNEVGKEYIDVTTANDDVKRSKAHKNRFNPPKRKPTKNEERKMIGKSVEILIISCMKNHVYKFGNKIRKQS